MIVIKDIIKKYYVVDFKRLAPEHFATRGTCSLFSSINRDKAQKFETIEAAERLVFEIKANHPFLCNENKRPYGERFKVIYYNENTDKEFVIKSKQPVQ